MRGRSEILELENEDFEDGIVFLTVEEIVTLHKENIQLYSPHESLTIINQGALESAAATPQQTFSGQFLYGSLEEMAVAYLICLAFNHAFENGNKRVGFAACSTFLLMNGYKLVLTQDEAESLTMGLVTHKMTREEAVHLLEEAIILL